MFLQIVIKMDVINVKMNIIYLETFASKNLATKFVISAQIKINAMNADIQKPVLPIQAFFLSLRKTKSNAKAVKAAVYLLSPAKPSNTPVNTQSPRVKWSFLSQRKAINMRPRLSGVKIVSGNKPIERTWGIGAAMTARTAMSPHDCAEGKALVK